MMKVMIIYNECMCAESFFLGDAPPPNMAIEAIVGSPVVESLSEQLDFIGKRYG